MAHYLVTMSRGPAWDSDRARRVQDRFDEHAAFMDDLTEQGLIVIGGPVGDDVDAGDALLVVRADDETAVREVLGADPWLGNVLTIDTVQKWTLWLRASGQPSHDGA